MATVSTPSSQCGCNGSRILLRFVPGRVAAVGPERVKPIALAIGGITQATPVVNQLRLKARNSAGVCGPDSHAAVVMNT